MDLSVRLMRLRAADRSKGVASMKPSFQAGSQLLFRPKVTPEPAAMESLQKRIAAFSYSPEDGLHRDKIQPRLRPLASASVPSWLFSGPWRAFVR